VLKKKKTDGKEERTKSLKTEQRRKAVSATKKKYNLPKNPD
jgi:hypothetical protein